MTTDEQLLVRGIDTFLACWEEYARGTTGGELLRVDGVAAAPPERRSARLGFRYLGRILEHVPPTAPVG